MHSCTCSNPKCPNARQFSACQHCMCLTKPDFGPNQTIGYAGPIYRACCQCEYQEQIGGARWSVTA